MLFTEMLDGFTNFQTARGREATSIAKQLSALRGLVEFADAWPWAWTAELVDGWSAQLKDERGLARSTLRARQGTVRLFMAYLTNPAYAWTARCRELFGVAPVQVCHDWNTTRHLEDYEGTPERRPLDDAEKARLFAAADAAVEAARAASDKGLVTCWRDSAMLKLLYGSGCRISELVALELADLHRHPAAPTFGRYAVVHVRHGKASPGGGPRRRAVQMVLPWVVDALGQYVEWVRPELPAGPWLFPSERLDRHGRQGHVSDVHFRRVFRELCDAAGLDELVVPHVLRHTYFTDMAARGRDVRWRQTQAGHKLLSSQQIYDHVTSDQMNRELTRALAEVLGGPPRGKGG
ncbi:MAG TPA: tyrosine-type recombinase/integrase [Streptosporangiaceae bacterium]